MDRAGRTARPAEGRGDLARRLKGAAQAPVLRRDLFPRPVTLSSVELLRSRRHFLVRARSKDGAVLDSAWPILVKRVAPFCAGKDAREVEALVDGVYLDQSNYKWQGLPFWSCVASVELAVLDLLGQVAGRSLGSAVATELAVRHKAGALIIESGFTSVPDLGRKFFPHLPVRLISRFHYATMDKVGGIPIPKLFIHSPDDEIIPFEQGMRLFEKAREPREFLKIRGGHNEGFLMSGEQYTGGIDRFLSKYF